MSSCRHGGRDVYENPWIVTTTSFNYKGDTRNLKTVFVNGIRFVRSDTQDEAPEPSRGVEVKNMCS